MKKLKLKEKIKILESENINLLRQLTFERKIAQRMISLLKEHNVDVEIEFPIDATELTDMSKRSATDLPTINFDFTNHDLQVIRKHSK